MTKAETAQLLYIVKANYPKFYKGLSEQEFKDMVHAWYICICDYDYNLAQAGVKVFLSADTKGYPPVVGQIIESIHRIQREENDGLTELDAWGLVYKALCNSYYNSEQEFDKLPRIVQRAVGDPARLKEWGQLDIKDVQTVIQSNFMRSFKAVQTQWKVYQRMPEDIKQMLPGDDWNRKMKVIDMTQEEEQKVKVHEIRCSSQKFVTEKMAHFYDIMGIN